jgi:hypothetical protein
VRFQRSGSLARAGHLVPPRGWGGGVDEACKTYNLSDSREDGTVTRRQTAPLAARCYEAALSSAKTQAAWRYSPRSFAPHPCRAAKPRGHAEDTLVRNMPPACVCSAGDGSGKINCNTVSRDDSGRCHDMGGVYGNPRPLTTPSCNIATRRPSPRQSSLSGVAPGPASPNRQAGSLCTPSEMEIIR